MLIHFRNVIYFRSILFCILLKYSVASFRNFLLAMVAQLLDFLVDLLTGVKIISGSLGSKKIRIVVLGIYKLLKGIN